MTEKGTVTEHKMFAKNDPGSGWGCNEGRIKRKHIKDVLKDECGVVFGD